jgi:hypothetical protein
LGVGVEVERPVEVVEEWLAGCVTADVLQHASGDTTRQWPWGMTGSHDRKGHPPAPDYTSRGIRVAACPVVHSLVGLAGQGSRWDAPSVNFYRAPEIAWR